MVRLGYVRFGSVRFSYIRFLYFIIQKLGVSPCIFFPDCHIMAFNQATDRVPSSVDSMSIYIYIGFTFICTRHL